MYQMTAEPALADAARFWVERTLDLCSTDNAQPGWKGPGLLEGAAGVALALLAAGSTVRPVWDQMLLVSTTGIPGVEVR
jgi:hypothetical protein